MSDKPMTEYLEYKYNDVSDVAAKMSDVNDIIERVVTIEDEMKMMKRQLNELGEELLSSGMVSMKKRWRGVHGLDGDAK